MAEIKKFVYSRPMLYLKNATRFEKDLTCHNNNRWLQIGSGFKSHSDEKNHLRTQRNETEDKSPTCWNIFSLFVLLSADLEMGWHEIRVFYQWTPFAGFSNNEHWHFIRLHLLLLLILQTNTRKIFLQPEEDLIDCRTRRFLLLFMNCFGGPPGRELETIITSFESRLLGIFH